MTRWGFIADVHGNLAALRRAQRLLAEVDAEELVYLGDLLGPRESGECVELVRATARLSVVGNRDRDWADRVDARSRDYVLGLPIAATAADFVATHGDARLHPALNTLDLGRDLRRSYVWLRQHERRVAFWGHSHRARVWRKRGPMEEIEHLSGHRVDLPALPETVYVVNVGTTGLPFPGKGPPCCAVYDDLDRWIEFLPLGPGRGRMEPLNG